MIKNIMKNIIFIVLIGLVSEASQISAVAPETTTIYCEGGEVPAVPRRIVELSGTFAHQMEDAGSSKEVLSMQSCEDTHAFIELIERSIPPELQNDPHAKLLGDAEPVIQKNIVQNLTQKLSCNSLNLFHSVLSFVETGNYLDCPVVRHGAEEALVRYVTEADNVDYFFEHPPYYEAMIQALGGKPQEIHDEMRDILMSSRADLNNFYEKYTLRHDCAIRSVAYSPNGRQLASGSVDGVIAIWNLENGNIIRSLRCHTAWVNSVAYSPNGRRLASGSNDGTIKIWDLESENLMRLAPMAWVTSVAYSPDGLQLASGCDDRTIKIWDPENGNLIRTLDGQTPWMISVAYSPNGRQLASGSDRDTIRIWDPKNGNLIRTLEGHVPVEEVTSVAYSPDGKQLASGSDDSTIKIWDLACGNPIRTLSDHIIGTVNSVTYSPDGKQLASGSNDNTIRIWDLRTDMTNPIRALRGHTSCVNSVEYSPDGKQLASGSDDNTIKIWQFQPKDFTEYFSLPQLMVYVLLRNAAGKQIIAKGFIAHLVIALDTIMRNAYVGENISAEEFQDYEDSLAQVQVRLSPEELKKYQLSPEPVYIRGT